MPPAISVQSSERLFPDGYLDKLATSTRLSIIDANVANWGICSATWYLDDPCTRLTPAHFRDSFRAVLCYYPQWCGKISLNPYNPVKTGHEHRYGRLRVRYHDKSDPGAGFVVAACSSTLVSLIPGAEERSASHRLWRRNDAPSSLFVPSQALAKPTKDSVEANNPGFIVQITTFECGGVAITIVLTHCLADAHAMVHFAKDWAAISRSLLGPDLPKEISAPVFDPTLLDNRAAGNLDAPTVDEKVLAAYKALPTRGHDQWGPAPWPVTIPEPFATNDEAKKLSGIPLPWATWDTAAPASHTVVHFNPSQLLRIHRQASSGASDISMHDALLGHIWACIARAKSEPISAMAAEENGTDDPFFLYLTLGLRAPQRLGLGDNFMGSPIIHAAASLPKSKLVQDDHDDKQSATATGAIAIRAAMGKFTPAAIGAFLYRIAFEATPQRLWHCFLGSRHTIVTSWVHAGLYDVDFSGTGDSRIRYAEGVMDLLDGIVQIQEGTPHRGGAKGEAKAKKWWSDGVDVSITLESEAMKRFLLDELLFPETK